MDVDNLAQISDDSSFIKCHRCGIITQIADLSGSTLFCDDCSTVKSRLGLGRMGSAVFIVVASLTVIFFILLLDSRVATDSSLSLSRFNPTVGLEEARNDMNIVISSNSAVMSQSAAPLIAQSAVPTPTQVAIEGNQPNSMVEPTATETVFAELSSESSSETPSSSLTESESDHKKYLVVAGDSLYAIAEQFLPANLTLDEYTQLIRDANSIGNSDDLSIGMELLIPQIRDVSE